ncbi:MAG: PEP/pyruvate-binding domain-containing protein [Pseudomonadales bacterium]
MNPWVVNLRDAAAGDATLTGGKAARLSRLARAGMAVPDAFVITSAAFSAHFPAADPDRRPQPPALHSELVTATRTALASQFPDQSYLVVRSSSTSEDGDLASFAGQHDSYYYITPDDVPRALVACWLSLWSDPALSYRETRAPASGTNGHGAFAMAVIVQRMLEADRSGVCFTSDPTGAHADHAWIEATWGLGAALVDGRVSPDRLLLERSGVLVRREIGRKRHKVAAALSDPGDLRLEPVPAFQQTASVLSDAEAIDVLHLSLEAERLFGGPQDVEWAFQGETLYLLQSRPITAVGSRPAAQPDAARPPGRWVLFKPLAENFTEPLTPLSVDLFRRVLPPIGRFVDGHYYLSLDIAERLCPLRWRTDELVDALLLRGEPPPLQPNLWKLPLAAVGFAALYLVDGISWHRSAHLTRDGLTAYAALCQSLKRGHRDDVPALLQRLVLGAGHPFEPIGRRAYYLNVSAGRYFLLLGALTALMARYAPDLDRRVVQSLCSGDGDTFSRYLVEDIRGLAEVARSDVRLRHALRAADPTTLGSVLAELAPDHPFTLALEAFLGRFGHRCSKEMELATPRWREDPLPVLLMVRGYLSAPTGRAPDTHADTLLARDGIRQALPRRWQQHLADYLIRRIRYYVSLRENTRHYHAMAMDVARGKLLELEQRLLAARRLRVPGDLFYLTWDEARDLDQGRLAWQDVSERIRQRRRRRRGSTRAVVPDTLGLADAQGATRANGRSEATGLRGQCASPGSAEGRVRIVLDPACAHDLEPGDILVAPYTDPGWTPLFPLVGAVVVEIGSFLSHAGTVAREYGIPCLVDVTGCTQTLREGQRIRVFASEGRLEICAP